MNAQEAMPIAMKFEHKAFLDAADKVGPWSSTAKCPRS